MITDAMPPLLHCLEQYGDLGLAQEVLATLMGIGGGVTFDISPLGISPNAWQHVHLIGAFDFEQTESQIDIDALAARYDDPDFWNRALVEAPDDSLT